MPLWLVTTDDQCTQAAGQAQLRAEWVIVQVGAGQPEPRGLPRGTALLVATGVPHDPHMAVHALEDRPGDTGHLVVHQRGGPAWLKEHVTALRSWASTIAGAEIRLHDHPAISPGDTRALSMDQLTHSHPDVRWHSTDLNAGWLSPTGYYWIPEAWGHTSSDASGGGPCKHATSVALAADLTRTWAVAISGTVPDGEGVAASLPLHYGAHRPWVHTVDAEVILHLLRHADRERTTGVPAGAAKVVNQMPLRWLRDGLCARGQHAGHPFWYVRATSHHSDALLHKADWAASQDTVLQNTPPDPGHAQLIVAGRDGHLDLRPPTMRVLGEVAQRAQTDHALTHRGHTPLGAGPRHGLRPRPGPHRGGHQPPGAAGPGRPHAGAAQAPRPEGAALRRRHRPAAVPFLRRPGRDPGAHARGLHPLAAPLAPLPPGGARGGPPPPTWGQGPVGGLVALRRRHVDRGVLLRTGARGRGGAAPRHNPIRPAGRDLGGRLPPPHAPARGLRVGASQPPAGATPPRPPKRGGPGAPVAHCGGGRPPSPSPAP